MTADASHDEQLAEAISDFYADPLGYVMFVFPWGEPGTTLEHEGGPDDWQRDFLTRLGEEVRLRGFDGRTPVDPVQMGVVSGHGSGKSALSAWLIKWLMSTRPNCKGTVTASTSPQLETKTWPELAKWHKISADRDWFDITMGRGSMKYVAKANPEGWRCTAQTSTKENSESFAGQHAADSSSWYLFDEASAVPDEISDVAQGGLTDGEPFWFQFGNGTRNSGRFYRIFHGERHRWITFHVDSRTCKKTNKALHQQWIDDYGITSDFVKVRVLGQFPSQSAMQFIASDVVEAARCRDSLEEKHLKMVIGVDVARGGGDDSVIARRRGRDARSWPWVRLNTRDTMVIVGKVVELFNEHVRLNDQPVVMLDETGLGGPIGDRLRQLGVPVIGVQFGGASSDPTYADHRSQIWGRMKDWMVGGAIPDDQRLADDLTQPEYSYDRNNAFRLESKDAMKARGCASPDAADALACTFSVAVPPKESGIPGAMQANRSRTQDNPLTG